MSLLLTIIEFPENCTVQEPSKTFGEQGGTIGRDTDNYWVLSDPDCYLSSCHSKITFEQGAYILTDMSTNGTFLNGSREPLGKGSKVQLQDGDEIELSDYKFKITLLEDNKKTAINSLSTSGSTSSVDPLLIDDPFSQPMAEAIVSPDISYTDPFASGDVMPAVESIVNAVPQEKDPLVLLDGAATMGRRVSDNAVFDSHSFSDQSDILGQSMDWPKPAEQSSMIPENWDDDKDTALLESDITSPALSVKPAQQTEISSLKDERRKMLALQNENIKLRKELNLLKQQLARSKKEIAHSLPGNVSVDITTIQAMGLDARHLDKEQITEINRMAGEIIRETIAGMMKVLTSRNSIKNEFRMNVTTIQPVENNPLKFSANVDDAIENMFLKKGRSYKKPVEAIQDGFHGIAEHQVAILAGIRAAFEGAIERFNPDNLEDRFERQGKGYLDFISGLKKAKNWKRYTGYYAEIFDDMDNSFQYLFGDEFVRAYEDQLQRLAIERKTKLHGV